MQIDSPTPFRYSHPFTPPALGFDPLAALRAQGVLQGEAQDFLDALSCCQVDSHFDLRRLNDPVHAVMVEMFPLGHWLAARQTPIRSVNIGSVTQAKIDQLVTFTHLSNLRYRIDKKSDASFADSAYHVRLGELIGLATVEVECQFIQAPWTLSVRENVDDIRAHHEKGVCQGDKVTLFKVDVQYLDWHDLSPLGRPISLPGLNSYYEPPDIAAIDSLPERIRRQRNLVDKNLNDKLKFPGSAVNISCRHLIVKHAAELWDSLQPGPAQGQALFLDFRSRKDLPRSFPSAAVAEARSDLMLHAVPVEAGISSRYFGHFVCESFKRMAVAQRATFQVVLAIHTMTSTLRMVGHDLGGGRPLLWRYDSMHYDPNPSATMIVRSETDPEAYMRLGLADIHSEVAVRNYAIKDPEDEFLTVDHVEISRLYDSSHTTAAQSLLAIPDGELSKYNNPNGDQPLIDPACAAATHPLLDSVLMEGRHCWGRRSFRVYAPKLYDLFATDLEGRRIAAAPGDVRSLLSRLFPLPADAGARLASLKCLQAAGTTVDRDIVGRAVCRTVRQCGALHKALREDADLGFMQEYVQVILDPNHNLTPPERTMLMLAYERGVEDDGMQPTLDRERLLFDSLVTDGQPALWAMADNMVLDGFDESRVRAYLLPLLDCDVVDLADKTVVIAASFNGTTAVEAATRRTLDAIGLDDHHTQVHETIAPWIQGRVLAGMIVRAILDCTLASSDKLQLIGATRANMPNLVEDLRCELPIPVEVAERARDLADFIEAGMAALGNRKEEGALPEYASVGGHAPSKRRPISDAEWERVTRVWPSAADEPTDEWLAFLAGLPTVD